MVKLTRALTTNIKSGDELFCRIASSKFMTVTPAHPDVAAIFYSAQLGEFKFTGTVEGFADVKMKASCPKYAY